MILVYQYKRFTKQSVRRTSRDDKHCKSGEMTQAQLTLVSEHVRTTSCQNKRTLKSKALRPTSY